MHFRSKTQIDNWVFLHCYKRCNRIELFCLFAWLFTRAVHLESTASLSKNDCKTALRRFIAKRCAPKLLNSDNVTVNFFFCKGYFVGSCKQLRSKPIKFIETTRSETLQVHNIEWCLKPPSALHFGGVWERLVAMIKTSVLSKSRF